MEKYRIYYVDSYKEQKTLIYEGTYSSASNFARTLGNVTRIEDLSPTAITNPLNTRDGYTSDDEYDLD